MAKIKTLKDLVGYHEHFSATVDIVRSKKGQVGELVVCLLNVEYQGVEVIDHTWVQRVEGFVGIKQGARIKFRASVKKVGYESKICFGTPQQVREVAQ
jgi:hypothetical protein